MENKLISTIEWYKHDIKPIIPEGRYAVSVLMITYDPVYDEINPGHGWEVHNGLYGSTKYRDGSKIKYFEKIDRDFDFMSLYFGDGYSDYGPICDRLVYWAYVPQMINGEFVR